MADEDNVVPPLDDTVIVNLLTAAGLPSREELDRRPFTFLYLDVQDADQPDGEKVVHSISGYITGVCVGHDTLSLEVSNVLDGWDHNIQYLFWDNGTWTLSREDEEDDDGEMVELDGLPGELAIQPYGTNVATTNQSVATGQISVPDAPAPPPVPLATDVPLGVSQDGTVILDPVQHVGRFVRVDMLGTNVVFDYEIRPGTIDTFRRNTEGEIDHVEYETGGWTKTFGIGLSDTPKPKTMVRIVEVLPE